MSGLKKRADVNKKEEVFIPGKTKPKGEKEKMPESNRVVLTEHKSLSTKPIESTLKGPAISQDNLTYLTAKKSSGPTRSMKTEIQSKKPKGGTKSKQIETPVDQQDTLAEQQDEGNASYTEKTEIKTVFQLPQTQMSKCAEPQKSKAVEYEEQPLSKHTEYAKDKSYTPSELRDENFVSLDRIKLSGKKLGEGGFSVVHQGVWLGTNVAVKVINITNKKDEKKAIEEIKRMIKLRHPRVIELYKYSIDETNSGTHIYMVMQRMQSDLSNYQFRDFTDKLRVIRQIVQGLRMLHEESIVHRDLKPQNILIDGKGDIRLADLGISALLDSEEPKSMTVAFTLKYAPPEVCIESITHLKNDIWSLGLVIYEILTGSPPWNNHRKQQIMKGLFMKQCPLDNDWQQRIEIIANDKETASILIELIRSCTQVEMQHRPVIAQVQERLATVTNSTY